MRTFEFADNMLTEREQKLCWEAHAEMPQKKTIFKTKNETRVFTMMRLPLGAITEETRVSKDKLRYQTPGASIGTKDPIIYYQDGGIDGDHKSCTWSEWKKWHGGNFETEAPPKTKIDPALEARMRAIRASFTKYNDDKEHEEEIAEAIAEDRKSGRGNKK